MIKHCMWLTNEAHSLMGLVLDDGLEACMMSGRMC